MTTKGQATRKKIIDRAVHLFSVKGYYNTSINDILAETGLTKGGLYGHFQSKEAIWYAAYDQAVSLWTSIVFDNVRQIDDPLERIKQALANDLRNYLGKDVIKGGCFFLNMLVDLSGQSNAKRDFVMDGMFGFSKVITRWLHEAREKSLLRSGLDLKRPRNLSSSP